METDIKQLKAQIAEMQETLQWIKNIADVNYEQDTKLRTQGARTLARISKRAASCLQN